VSTSVSPAGGRTDVGVTPAGGSERDDPSVMEAVDASGVRDETFTATAAAAVAELATMTILSGEK
jgi:hypothetical protein